MTDLFGNAGTAPKTKTTKPSTGKKDKPRIELEGVKDADAYTALVTLRGIIDGMMTQHGGQVREESLEIFVGDGMELGKKPETFIGETGESELEFQLKKRTASSPLTEEEQERMKTFGFEMVENIKVAGEDEHFGINPKLLQNRKAMRLFSDALSNAGLTEIDGEPILLKHEAVEEVKVWNTSDTTIDEIFAAGKEGVAPSGVEFGEDDVFEFIEMVATRSLGKAKMVNVQGDNYVEHAIEMLRKHGIDLSMTPDEAAKAIKDAKKK